MSTKPKARKFRIRRSDAPVSGGTSAPSAQPTAAARPVAAAPTPEPAVTRNATAAPSAGRPAAASSQPAAQSHSAPVPARTTAVAAGTPGTALSGEVQSRAEVASQTDIDQIRREGLTGRQLRMARRVAQRHGLAVTSDFDAVRQLRAKGVDPFERSSILELVTPRNNQKDAANDDRNAIGRIQLPQTVPAGGREVGMPRQGSPAEDRMREIKKIQVDLARRRKRKVALLFTRLSFFVFLPTIICGYYFFKVATPMYATTSEFVIQQAEPAAAGAGLGGLFQGTSMATQQDSITVQSYLTSRAAMVRLDEEYGFKTHFSDPSIDPIQRLPEDASNEEAFKVYARHVRLSYDPTEGILKLEVVATDPETSQRFSEALVGYAEEQVDQVTQRLRIDQMAGAEQSYQEAEIRREEALAALLAIQNVVEVLSPEGEVSALLAQVSQLETQRQQKMLELAALQSVQRPIVARVEAVQREIADLEQLIAQIRTQMTTTSGDGQSLAAKTTELRLAEENYQFQTMMVQQALTMRESARLEAERQVRYLSVGVAPIAPDEATYPRAFENTAVCLLIFSGIYLMLSLTASILREQISS